MECSVLLHCGVFGFATVEFSVLLLDGMFSADTRCSIRSCYTVECLVLLHGGVLGLARWRNVLSCETVECGIFDSATLTLRNI